MSPKEVRAADVELLKALIETLSEDLRDEALTHSSWSDGRDRSYERLAFLGDSVLGLAVAEEVYRRHPDVSSGRLSQIANQAVSGVSCAAVGRALGVPDMLSANEPDEPIDRIPAETLLAAGRPLPEVTEALIGACYLHHGIEKTAPAVVAAFNGRIHMAAEELIDFKSALQEKLAQRGKRVHYRVVSESGPPHQRTFAVEAVIEGQTYGEGSGRSKKAAEQIAAEQALKALDG